MKALDKEVAVILWKVNSQEEILQTSYWQFNSLFEETIAKRHIATSASN